MYIIHVHASFFFFFPPPFLCGGGCVRIWNLSSFLQRGTKELVRMTKENY